jgi:hypothetical protein
MKRLLRWFRAIFLEVPFALILLFEEWGWQPLANLVGQLARLAAWAALERWIAQLPPYAALALFVTPTVLLFPFKIAALWLLAHGQRVAGLAVMGAAKVVGTAVVARLFQLTKPRLLMIPWYARLYGWWVPWKESWLARIRASFVWRVSRAVKWRVKKYARGVRDGVRAWWRRFRGRALDSEV